MAGKPTLPFISEEQLPEDATEALRIAAQAQGMGEKIQRAIEDVGGQNMKDKVAVGQLYRLVDRMRVSAKDAQNYVDRSLNMSHTFFPMIEKSYPCGGADQARNMAHGLHIWIGRTKDVIGNPTNLGSSGGLGGSLETGKKKAKLAKGGEVPSAKSGRGAADLLRDMERQIGLVSGNRPQKLYQMLNTQEQSIPPLLTIGFTPPCPSTAQGIEGQVNLKMRSTRQKERRSLALARFL